MTKVLYGPPPRNRRSLCVVEHRPIAENDHRCSHVRFSQNAKDAARILNRAIRNRKSPVPGRRRPVSNVDGNDPGGHSLCSHTYVIVHAGARVGLDGHVPTTGSRTVYANVHIIVETVWTASQSGSQFTERGSGAVLAGNGIDSTVLTGTHGWLN